MPTIRGKPSLSRLRTLFNKEDTTSPSTSQAAVPAEGAASSPQHPSPHTLKKAKSGSEQWLKANTETDTPESTNPDPTSKKSLSHKSSFAKFGFGRKTSLSNLLDSASASPGQADDPQSASPLTTRKGSEVWAKKTPVSAQSDIDQELDHQLSKVSTASSGELRMESFRGSRKNAGKEIAVGRETFHLYQQWRTQTEKEHGLQEWQQQRQQTEKKLKDELHELLKSSPISIKVLPDAIDLLDLMREKLGEASVLGRLTPETKEYIRKIDFIKNTVKPIIDAEEKKQKATGKELQKGQAYSVLVEGETGVGSFNANLRTNLLEKSIDDFIETHKIVHAGAFPDTGRIKLRANALLEKTRKAATNENWMASLSGDLKEAARSHLEGKKSQIPKGMDPQIARDHLDAQIDGMLNRMLGEKNPHDETTWEEFDKHFQEELPILVANAVTLPILFDRLGSFMQRQPKVEQRKAELDQSMQALAQSKKQEPRYLSMVEDFAGPILEKLQEEDKTQGAVGQIYAKNVDPDLRERKLIEKFTKEIEQEWQHDGVNKRKIPYMQSAAENDATTYVGIMDVSLREKIIAEKILSYAKRIEDLEDELGHSPTINSLEEGITKLYRKATKEATDTWIQDLTNELTDQCTKLAGEYIKEHGEYIKARTFPGGPEHTSHKYDLSAAAKDLSKNIPDKVREIIKELEEEGLPANAEDMWRKFNDKFGEVRKKLIDDALDNTSHAAMFKAGTELYARKKSVPEAVAAPMVAGKLAWNSVKNAPGRTQKAFKDAVAVFSKADAPMKELLQLIQHRLPEDDRNFLLEVLGKTPDKASTENPPADKPKGLQGKISQFMNRLRDKDRETLASLTAEHSDNFPTDEQIRRDLLRLSPEARSELQTILGNVNLILASAEDLVQQLRTLFPPESKQ